MTEPNWSVSGLCIMTRPENLVSVEARLNDLPGVEVHASDPGNGRLVVVQEGTSVGDHQDGLRRIQAVPGVLTAELVMHYEVSEPFSQKTDAGGTR